MVQVDGFLKVDAVARESAYARREDEIAVEFWSSQTRRVAGRATGPEPAHHQTGAAMTQSIARVTEELNLRCAAATAVPVLVTAEPGSDIESVVRLICARSVRRDLAFLTVDCAAVSASGLEASLSTGGTVYLHEVGQLNLSLRSILSRALESHTRGARILAGTTSDVCPGCSEDALSEDLFYRLNVIHIVLPKGGQVHDVASHHDG